MLLHLSVAGLLHSVQANSGSQVFEPCNLKSKVQDFDLILMEAQNAEQFYPLDLLFQQVVT